MRDWEAHNAKALQEREAQLQREQEEAELLTYTREDAYSMVQPCPTWVAAWPAASCALS